MRLLDLIAQGRGARVCAEDGRELPGANRFSGAIRDCPTRYVLSDDLVRCSTQLAYAEGDRLSACLDLIHAPAQRFWVEWAEEPRRDALDAIPELAVKSGPSARHGGALVTASPGCRSGHFRSFWSTPDDCAYVSPIVTTFDFDRAPRALPIDSRGAWRGECVLRLEGEPAIEELLAHVRYHFDEEWAAYYAECHSAEVRAAVLRQNLNGCAFDGPMLMAFFLLLGARHLLPCQTVCHERLNRVRGQNGKPPLLERIDVSAPLNGPSNRHWEHAGDAFRVSPRLHHVRGHIVRRGTAVFWRCPHLRGSARRGYVRSRTVLLDFVPHGAELARSYH